MTTTWTEQHSIDLIEAYIGAEIERSPKGEVLVAGDDWRQPLPDMSKDGEWLMRCVEAYFKINSQRGWMTFEVGPHGLLVHGFLLPMVERQTIHEALAWALWEARGKDKESK